MRAEYLLFDLLVLAVPLLVGAWRRAWFYDRLGTALRAVIGVGVPFVLWDAAVAGRHWWFDPRYVLGVELLGLPVEELLFFVAIPLACLFTWETVLGGARAEARPGLVWLYPVLWALVPLGVLVAGHGEQYTGAVLIALGLVALLDHALGAGLLLAPRAHVFFAVVVLLTLVFNGYLTGRPVVHYGEAYQLGLHIGTIPVEDFAYGLALVWGSTVLYQRGQGRLLLPSWPARGIRRAFGGYQHVLVEADAGAPLRAEGPARRVAVVGAGLAGLTAASRLAERGVAVTLFEREGHLGGKLGAWTDRASDGSLVRVEHGFHAFFRHYYNLDAFLRERGLHRRMRSIGSYLIIDRQGRRTSFDGVATTPVLNLISLARHGLYRMSEVAFGPAGRKMEAFLRYDPVKTPARWDEVSFARFAREARLPASLLLVFNTFARAFFADAERISMAELIKSFHFYYLSHDHGLEYDYLEGHYHEDLLEPLREQLLAQGVRIRSGDPVERIDGGDGFTINGARFDEVVLATDAASARAIVEASPLAERVPALREAVRGLRAGQRYSVLRVWVEAPTPEDVPVFVITERGRVLDAITMLHRIDEESRGWARGGRGSVLELHCYALPDELVDEAEIVRCFLREAGEAMPTLAGARVVRHHLQLRSDFTAFHVGMHAGRPGVETPVPGLYLAGDWVRLPFPAMLMEAACSSGLLAANAILARMGVRGFPVHSVPPRGLLAGRPEEREEPEAAA
ncbi:MAG: lycopene cyclase domain-containing protein [Myxococcales bacterium]|nr:lycopene cyclase domain-containing protein [Myxococcales bacterium]